MKHTVEPAQSDSQKLRQLMSTSIDFEFFTLYRTNSKLIKSGHIGDTQLSRNRPCAGCHTSKHEFAHCTYIYICVMTPMETCPHDRACEIFHSRFLCSMFMNRYFNGEVPSKDTSGQIGQDIISS